MALPGRRPASEDEKMTTRRSTAAALAATGLATALLVGCAGAPRTPATSAGAGRTATGARCIELIADPLPASPAVGVRRGAGSTCEQLEVELLVSGVSDVFAASFDALFDPAIVRYVGIETAGSFLASDGAELQALDRADGGRAVIGVTRWRQSTGRDARGPSVLATLRFRAAGPLGDSALRFDPASLLGSEMPPAPKPGVSWAGGTIRTTALDGGR